MLLKVCFVVCCVNLLRASGESFQQPEQIHLAYGGDPTRMVVTWVTLDATNSSVCEYGPIHLDMVAKGMQTTFQDGGGQKRKLYIHSVTLEGLSPGKLYLYHVGSAYGWSDKFSFSAMKAGTDWSPSFAVYGDMGNVNGQSIGRLQQEAQSGLFDAILHVGDFAYDMDSDDARVGDAFMNQIQPMAAYIPYMTAVGNHEQAYNFSNYKNRFTMPGGDGQGMFYSIDIGPIHFIMFSSEFYYFPQWGWTQIIEQYRWLEQDLISDEWVDSLMWWSCVQKANLPENRAARPWIISMCHRPLYCSNSDDDEHCTNIENIIRVGLPILRAYGIEELLYKYGVDLHFQAHEHSYERMWPVYNLTVCNGSTAEPYTNPRAPVHIVTGSAGCQEYMDPFDSLPHPWSAFRSDDYGFTRMRIINNTHLHIEQTSDNKSGAVIDEMLLIKQKHGAGLYDCHVDALRDGPMLDGFGHGEPKRAKAKQSDPEPSDPGRAHFRQAGPQRGRGKEKLRQGSDKAGLQQGRGRDRLKRAAGHLLRE